MQRSCHLYGVSRQGLYQRRQRPARQAERDAAILVQVRAVRTRLPRLGTRKLRHKLAPLLRAQGVACGRDALFTLLRQHQLLVAKKRSYTKTTDSHHRFHCHPNLVQDAPKPTAPHQLWVSDLARAVRGPHDRAIHHSDRGSQYASDAYQAARQAAGLRCSMTDGYDCYQNALAERVNGILKDEFLFVLVNELAQARLLVDQAVYRYNEERPHLALNYLTPNQVHPQGKIPAGKSERGPCLMSVNV